MDRKLEGFILDLSCQYSSHLRNKAGAQVLEELKCYVGWLHSQAGHNMSCQLKFSSMFAENLGRAIGENAEQLHVRLFCQTSNCQNFRHYLQAMHSVASCISLRFSYSFLCFSKGVN